jgi:phage terminase large subunit-like protein
VGSPDLLTDARRIGDATEPRRLDWMRYTEPQIAYMSIRDPAALWRDGNQVGKTTGVIDDMVHACRGTHPFRPVARPPINAIVMSESWEQMGQAGGFLEKLWRALPKDEIDPRIKFDPGRGITGKPPRIVFVRGPGKGSVITLATYRQGASRVAGGTVHFALLDEPPPPGLLDEILPRLLRHRGTLRLTFTPVLNMPDQRHLRALTEGPTPMVRQVNFHLQEANCWPRGLPTPWIDQASIDRMAATLPEAVRKMRIEGSWEPVRTERWLTNYDATRHIRPDRAPAGAWLAVGVDHGTAAGKQVAVLLAIAQRDGLRPWCWIIDEECSDGMTTPQQDARGILKMLARNNLAWHDVDEWVGDRPTGESRYLVRKSNTILRKHLANQAKVPLVSAPGAPGFPHFRTPQKHAGSVENGLWLMNALLGDFEQDGTPHMMIHPRCERFAAFCDGFDGDRWDPLKDVGDAGRYPIEVAIGETPSMRLIARY